MGKFQYESSKVFLFVSVYALEGKKCKSNFHSEIASKFHNYLQRNGK